ncbi:MAG: glycosyltransferase family A protein, partial [Acidimicrobiales bacterium]
MRIGENPARSGREPRSDAEIRVVVPVYIPELSGYFADAATILGICLDSLAATSGAETRITAVANACTPEVVESLAERQRTGAIDQLVVSHDNLGKVDGFLAGARSSWEPVVVVSDADVLWRSGWQVAMTSVLAAFPECGIVGAAPAPNLATYATSATVLDALARREVSRRSVVDPDDLARFADSVGTPDLFSGHESDQLVVERGPVTALVG